MVNLFKVLIFARIIGFTLCYGSELTGNTHVGEAYSVSSPRSISVSTKASSISFEFYESFVEVPKLSKDQWTSNLLARKSVHKKFDYLVEWCTQSDFPCGSEVDGGSALYSRNYLDGDDLHALECNSFICNGMISGLRPGTEYFIRISAYINEQSMISAAPISANTLTSKKQIDKQKMNSAQCMVDIPYRHVNHQVPKLASHEKSVSDTTATDALTINLLTASTGITISGATGGQTQFGHSGYAVSGAGDVNLDGYDDVIVSAPGCFSNSGIVYLIFGSRSLYNLDLGSLNSDGIKYTGPQAYSYLGKSVSSAGDFNGDGFSDYLISFNLLSVFVPTEADGSVAPHSSTPVRHVVGVGSKVSKQHVESAFDLSYSSYNYYGYYSSNNYQSGTNLVGTYTIPGHVGGQCANFTGYTSYYSENYATCIFTVCPSTPNEINLVTVSSCVTGCTGYEYLYVYSDADIYEGYGYGNCGNNGCAQVKFYTSASGLACTDYTIYEFCAFYECTGTVNVTIEAVQGSIISKSGTYLIPGRYESSESVSLSTATHNVYKYTVDYEYDHPVVSDAGDINNDGYDDFALAFPEKDIVYIVFGSETFKSLNVSSIDSESGFSITGIPYSNFGTSISSIGDFNGDGFADIVIGAPYYSDDSSYYHYDYNAPYYNPSSNAEKKHNARGHVLSSSDVPSEIPTELPTEYPSTHPTEIPSYRPSGVPFAGSSAVPTFVSSENPSVKPSTSPSRTPSRYPTVGPSEVPTEIPSEVPSELPSEIPSEIPSEMPVDNNNYNYNFYNNNYNFYNNNNYNFYNNNNYNFYNYYANHNYNNNYNFYNNYNNYYYYNYNNYYSYSNNYHSNSNYYSYSYPVERGISYIIYGQNSSFKWPNLVIGDTLPSYLGITILGEAIGDMSGSSVAGAGDVNNDGYDDVMIGAPGVNVNEGMCYVVYGGSDRESFMLGDLGQNEGFVIQGANAGNRVGGVLSSAGDVTGDGYDDMLLGGPAINSQSGETYLIYGGASLSNIHLNDLSSSQGVTFLDTTKKDYENGYSVAFAGDVNRDQYADYIIGAPMLAMSSTFTPTFYPTTIGEYSYGTAKPTASAVEYPDGISYLLFGNPDITEKTTVTLSALTNIFTITGNDDTISQSTGASVTVVGDVNGDGYEDVLIGSPAAGVYDYYGEPGMAYLIFGQSSGFNGVNLNSIVPGKTINITGGGVISEQYGYYYQENDPYFSDTVSRVNVSTYFLGMTSSGAGDFNNDGIPDFMITSFSSSYQGFVYLVFGSKKLAQANILTKKFKHSQGIIISDASTGIWNLGYSMDGIGDFNGDGIDDIVVGSLNCFTEFGYAAYSYPAYISCYAGFQSVAYVLYGASKIGDLKVGKDTIQPSQGFVIAAGQTYDSDVSAFGGSVTGIGNFNGDDDGLMDVAISDAIYNSNQGAVYIIFGSMDSDALASIDYSTLSQDGLGYVIYGNTADSLFGYVISGVGDFNDDGYPDILIGAPSIPDGGEGKAYIVYGGLRTTDLYMDDFTSADGIIISSGVTGDACGFSVSPAGDINRDKFPDVIIGCPYLNDYAGASYIITGSRYPQDVVLSEIISSQGYAINGAYSYDFSGYAVAGSADMSGNGIVLIGAPESNAEYGTAYIIITSTDGSFPNNQTVAPSPLPTSQPTSQPTSAPSPHPTPPPTMYPSPIPSKAPTPPPFWQENGPLIGGILGPALLGFIPIFFSKQICYYALEHWGSKLEEAKNVRRNGFQTFIYKGCKNIYIADYVKDKQARDEKAKRDAKLASEIQEHDIEMSNIKDSDGGEGHGSMPAGALAAPGGSPSRDRSQSKSLFSFLRKPSDAVPLSPGSSSSSSSVTPPTSDPVTPAVDNPMLHQSDDNVKVNAVYRIEYDNPVLNCAVSTSDDQIKLLSLPHMVDTSAKSEQKGQLIVTSPAFPSADAIATDAYTSTFLFCRQLVEYAPLLNSMLVASVGLNGTLPNNWLITVHLIAGHTAAMSLPQETLFNGLLLSTASSVVFASRLYSTAVMQYIFKKSSGDPKADTDTVSVWSDLTSCSVVVVYHAAPVLVLSVIKQYIHVPFTAFDGLNGMLSATAALQQCDALLRPKQIHSVPAVSHSSYGIDWKETVPVVFDALAVVYFGHNLFTTVPTLMSLQTASRVLTLLGNVATVHHVSKTVINFAASFAFATNIEESDRFPLF